MLAWTSGCGAGGGGGLLTPQSVNLGGNGGGNGGNYFVGSPLCLQCHFAYPANYFNGNVFDTRTYADAGQGIGPTYQKGVHGSGRAGTPQCEDCHGAGGQHYGTGPIPHWNPNFQQCNQCHADHMTPWSGTAHANPDGNPDQFYGQTSIGPEPATRDTGEWLFKADGVTPVTRNERIEECSTCHDESHAARPSHIPANNLDPRPMAGCPSCHDSHAPALQDTPVIPTRPAALNPDRVLRLKPVLVNNDPSQPQFGARNNQSGTWIRPTLWYPFNMTTVASDPAYAKTGIGSQNTTVGDLLRLTSERLCASCHTKGTWKYTAFANSTAYTTTHNGDVFSEYRQSGHANAADVPYADFSLLAALGGSHRPQYPIDMGRLDGRTQGGANNYACYQCHNGLGTIDFLNGVQGGLDIGDSSSAHVLFGDCSTTCISCHDPHANQGGTTTSQKNVRIPKYLAYNAWFNDTNNPGHGNRRGGLNAMMDGTPIPPGAQGQPSLICLFCHQGRESGYTLYRNALSKNFNMYTAAPGATVNTSFTNAHYFSGGATLWSKNSWEFTINGTAQTYSNGIPQHQQKNCSGCHMAAVTDTNITPFTYGGHTFKPGVQTCRECHTGLGSFFNVNAPVNVDGDANTTTVYESLGTLDATAAPTVNDRGLFGQLRWALYQNNIEYDQDSYPYFFKRVNPFNKANHTSANANTVWTAPQLQAAFNLGQLYKQGNAVYVHNFYYSSQILIDCLKVLGVTTNSYTGGAFVRPTTPPGGTTHTATDYRTIVIP